MDSERDNAASPSEQQRELLRQLLLEKINQPVEFAASCAQRRLWLVNQLEQPNSSYNIPCYISLRGTLDVALLEQSLNLLIERHSILRTSFIAKQGEPFQLISPQLKLSLPVVDLTSCEEVNRNHQVAEILALESEHIFDLSAAPLIRARLLHLKSEAETGTCEYVLIIVLHHIISDGWSMGVLSRDLFALYSSLKTGTQAPQYLSIQYSDYSKRQAEMLTSAAYARQLDYWKQHLADLPLFELPGDFRRPLEKGFRGANVVTRIDAGLVKKLNALCEQQSVTLSMLLSTVFGLLLYRYTNQNDIIFGSPVANRNHPEIENLIGFFVNMLVIRNHINGSESFSELLRKSRENLFSAYSNQDVPFENLVDLVQPERDLSRNPIFQVAFAMQNEVMPEIELDGLSIGRPVIPGYDISKFAVNSITARFDLELHCWDTEGDVRCSWIYDLALFNQSKIEAMSQHFIKLLEAVVRLPDSSVDSLSMLDRQQQLALLNQFSGTQTDYPSNASVNLLFEQQVEATPESIALVFDNQRLSYGELNRKANQLAHYLRAAGVGPEIMVGLYIERSIEMVISLLAILKAGGAYVPLDPEYPKSRIAFMLEDSLAPIVISHSSIVDRLPEYEGFLISLDLDWPEISKEAEDNPLNQVSAENLAYVIYTSGSTGTPKGVEIQHRAINRLVRDTDYYQVDASDRIAQASNVSFDAATFEIWGALLNGARLVGINKEVLLDSKSLAAFLRARGITSMFITTAVFNQIAREAPIAFSGLKGLMFGGEAVDCNAVLQVLMNHPPERLLHVYGPTESTTFASWYQVEEVSADATTVPIGRPLANTTLYVLDQKLNPVPVGVPGELFIGGDGLARGYLNQPELTAQKFVSATLIDQPEVRLYRTGDQVLYRDDGVIEFMGRLDHQVKLRGFRIELGEVEVVIGGHEAVKNAVVMMREDEPGNIRLVAYLVLDAKQSTTIGQIKEYVRSQLPEYMLPSAFVVLDELPLTTNGKVNRDALKPPQSERNVETSYVPPRSPAERQIADIWRELLAVGTPGIDDNFFDLGGNSLLLMRAHAKICEISGCDVPVTHLFRYPTIRELAKQLAANEQGRNSTGINKARERALKQRDATRRRNPANASR